MDKIYIVFQRKHVGLIGFNTRHDLTELCFLHFLEGGKEHDKLKEKQTRDFLRIKLKEKKKMKKTTSGNKKQHLFIANAIGS